MKLKRVKLKPKSPEFAEDEKDSHTSPHSSCEMPGCSQPAMHRAPKSRGLNDYYHFCLEHVQDYNRAWNFFEGMAPHDVEEHMKNNFYGHRPTWNYTSNRETEDDLRRRAYEFRGFDDFAEARKDAKDDDGQQEKRRNGYEQTTAFSQTAEAEAMAIMGLEPPLDGDAIKARYKELAKQYHPDLNRDDPKAEDYFKKVNMAYTVLKLAHEKYMDKFA